jgi:hypothetical protein
MSDARQERLVSLRDSVLKSLSIAQDRAERGKRNEALKDEYTLKLQKVNKDFEEFYETGTHLHDIYKNIESYAQQHQSSARDILDLAIATAGDLVPDAGTKGIHLQTEANNRVSIVNANGQNINLREGGGYRAVLGALLRYACLKAQPDAFQFILFDEYFFTLSDTTTQAMKDIFSAMKKDVTIVCIEQRKNAMDGILDAEFTFKKDDNGTTTVEKTI